MNPNYSKIVACASDRNPAGIQNIYTELLTDRMKLDKFFTMYLDKFERKMDPEKTNTPIWALYKKKLKEYGELQQTIKAAEYYLKKTYV
jgi:hypothetical protein